MSNAGAESVAGLLFVIIIYYCLVMGQGRKRSPPECLVGPAAGSGETG